MNSARSSETNPRPAPVATRSRAMVGRLHYAMQGLRRLSCVVSALLVVAASPGAGVTDLGQGLAYLRIHSIAESATALRNALPGGGALVLDLRYATADDAAAGVLKSALANRPTGGPLLVLVSPATPAVLAAAITASPAVTLGAPGSVPAPKVMVQTDAAADRRAYDALDAGTALAKLISGKIEKDRFDEASLVKEFKDGHDVERPPLADPATPKPGTVAPPDPALAAPIDRVLQRAVNLHRALGALRR